MKTIKATQPDSESIDMLVEFFVDDVRTKWAVFTDTHDIQAAMSEWFFKA